MREEPGSAVLHLSQSGSHSLRSPLARASSSGLLWDSRWGLQCGAGGGFSAGLDGAGPSVL